MGGDIMLAENLLMRSEHLEDQLTMWRRDFHMHPELGYKEKRTSTIVAEHLQSLGLKVTTGIGGTGVVGMLAGRAPGPTIALRADMDALPIQDEKQVSYRSQTLNQAHLCGHDAHTSILMGAAQILTEIEKPAYGNIKFIFQPAEELLAGADAMIKDGVLDRDKVDAIIGLHVYPSLPVGHIGGTRGIAFASVDDLEIDIIGRGGHGARPHEGIDAIAIAAQVINALQNISSRMTDPLEPVVISIGQIQGGTIGTAIASRVRMVGTVRVLSDSIRKQLPHLIEQTIKGVVSAFGADYILTYKKNYPTLRNHDDLLDLVIESGKDVLGDDHWHHMRPSTGGEDFGFYAKKIPAAFFRLGVGNGQEQTAYPLHHPKFNLDERALPLGAAMLSTIALNYLNDQQHKNNKKRGYESEKLFN